MVAAGTSGEWMDVWATPRVREGPAPLYGLIGADDSRCHVPEPEGLLQHLVELEEKIELMLTFYIDGMNNMLSFTRMFLGDEGARRSLGDDVDNLRRVAGQIRWLEDQYAPIRQRLEGVDEDDPDFSSLFAAISILYDEDGTFRLQTLADRMFREGDEVFGEMDQILSDFYATDSENGSFGGRIRDNMFEYLRGVFVDPRDENRVDAECTPGYETQAKRYERILAAEFTKTDWLLHERLKLRLRQDLTEKLSTILE